MANSHEDFGAPITQAEISAQIEAYKREQNALESFKTMHPSSKVDIRIRGEGDGLLLISQALGQLSANKVQPQLLELSPYIEQVPHDPRTIPLYYDTIDDPGEVPALEASVDTEDADLADIPIAMPRRQPIERPRVERRTSKKTVALMALAALAVGGAGAWNAAHSGDAAVKACKIDFTNCYPDQFISSFTFGMIHPGEHKK